MSRRRGVSAQYIFNQIMERNRQNPALSSAQHDALRFVASIRHEMHANQESFFLSDDPRHAAFELMIGRDGKGVINDTLRDCGLPEIRFVRDVYRVETDKGVKREDYKSEYEYEMALAQAFDRSREIIEELNDEIEAYLSEIDKEYGTQYCPTGKHRIYPETMEEKVQKKYDRSLAMMEYGTEFIRAYGEYATEPHKQIEKEGKAMATGEKQRLFVDMDGVLAEFKPLSTLEDILEKGYFLNLEPQQNVVNAIKELTKDYDVYILSATMWENRYAIHEKELWLDKYIPEIDKDHRLFPICGDDKKYYVPDGVRETDVLIDDYTENLLAWEEKGSGLKLMNGINGTRGTWQGERVDMNSPTLAKDIAAHMGRLITEQDFMEQKTVDEYGVEIAMETVPVTVYKDTVLNHNDDNNLAEVIVPKDFLNQWIKKNIEKDEQTDFMNNYDADWTNNLVEDMRNAGIENIMAYDNETGEILVEKGKYVHELNFGNEYLKNVIAVDKQSKKSMTSFPGAAYVWGHDLAAEYIYEFDHGEDTSAVYLMRPRANGMGEWDYVTDYGDHIRYEIDPENPNWQKDLVQYMEGYVAFSEVFQNLDLSGVDPTAEIEVAVVFEKNGKTEPATFTLKTPDKKTELFDAWEVISKKMGVPLTAIMEIGGIGRNVDVTAEIEDKVYALTTGDYLRVQMLSDDPECNVDYKIFGPDGVEIEGNILYVDGETEYDVLSAIRKDLGDDKGSIGWDTGLVYKDSTTDIDTFDRMVEAGNISEEIFPDLREEMERTDALAMPFEDAYDNLKRAAASIPPGKEERVRAALDNLKASLAENDPHGLLDVMNSGEDLIATAQNVISAYSSAKEEAYQPETKEQERNEQRVELERKNKGMDI